MAYANGKLPKSALATIPGGSLEKEAARCWVAMCNYIHSKGLSIPMPAGQGAAYRELGKPSDYPNGSFTQWFAYIRMQHGGNLAAKPGTSNHGWGWAVDADKPGTVNAYGDDFGYDHRWSDAPSEPWHIRWDRSRVKWAVVNKWYAKGPYSSQPLGRKGIGDPLVKGDKGPGVVYLQQRLQAHGFYSRYARVNGNLGLITLRALRKFQRFTFGEKGVDGIVGPKTWAALRAKPKGR